MLVTRPSIPLPSEQIYFYSFDEVKLLTARNVVLLYAVDRSIGDEDWQSALDDSILQDSYTVVRVAPLGRYQRENIIEEDWRLAEEINRELWQKIKRICDGRPGGYPDFHIFLQTPLPLAFHLGAVIRDRIPCFVYQGNRDGQFSIVKRPGSISDTQEYWQVNNLPTTSIQKGEVPLAITLSVTHSINTSDVEEGITLANEEPRYLDIVALSRAGGDPHSRLGSEREVSKACEEFRSITDQIRTIWPNRSGIHLFYAGPVSLAFLLGQICHLDLHPKFIFYQHGHNQYKPVVQFGKEDELPILRAPLDEIGLQRALGMLAKFRETYNSLQEAVKSGQVKLPNGIANSNEKTKRRLLSCHVIEDNELTITGERPFTFDHSLHHKWVFDAYFMLAFDSAKRENRFDSDQELEDAIRIFFLHELIHPDQQLTSRNAPNIGRAGLVLEAADYDADVFAFEGALEWYNHFSPDRLERSGESKILAELIKTALRVMALFDEAEQGGYPLKSLPVRRLRRYLIWHFQRIRSEMLQHSEVTPANLRQKPAIEITYLTEQVDKERFQNFISIDRLQRDGRSELAAYFGERIYRWSGTPGVSSPMDLVFAIMEGEKGWEQIAETFAFLLELSWGTTLPIEP